MRTEGCGSTQLTLSLARQQFLVWWPYQLERRRKPRNPAEKLPHRPDSVNSRGQAPERENQLRLW